MSYYAMVLLERVIDIVEAETPPYYPPDPQGNPVTAVVCDETVRLGMTYDIETGTFSEPAYEPTNEPPATPPLTETEQAVLQTAINTEYLLYLMESTI